LNFSKVNRDSSIVGKKVTHVLHLLNTIIVSCMKMFRFQPTMVWPRLKKIGGIAQSFFSSFTFT